MVRNSNANTVMLQVQNLFAEAPPGEITISGHSAVEPQPLGIFLALSLDRVIH